MNKVSVIIVNYNTGYLLVEAVNRVLNSSISVEVYVSDNVSIDDSLELLKKITSNYTNVHIIKNNTNLGFSKGNNVVLPFIFTDYLLFLNPDCLIETDTIEKMLVAISDHPNVGMAGCVILNTDGTEQAGCRRTIPTPWRSLSRVFKLGRILT